MNTDEKKLEIIHKIDNLSDDEFQMIYSKFIALLDAPRQYKTSFEESNAIREALALNDPDTQYSDDEVMDEARRKFPNLKFK